MTVDDAVTAIAQARKRADKLRSERMALLQEVRAAFASESLDQRRLESLSAQLAKLNSALEEVGQ